LQPFRFSRCHLFGWTWFGAIIGVLFFSCIPIIGQLGYIGLAVMGAYYLWAANFDWRQAAYPPTQTFSVSGLSDSELERFKGDVVRRGFEQACNAEALKTTGFDAKYPRASQVSANALQPICGQAHTRRSGRFREVGPIILTNCCSASEMKYVAPVKTDYRAARAIAKRGRQTEAALGKLSL
jgi:hypothetical protein